MLFDLTPKPIDPLTAPFTFDMADRCNHQLPDGGCIVADIAPSRGWWWWAARHTFPDDTVIDELEFAHKSEAGRAPTRDAALAECVAWMRGRLTTD